ncbi:MAG: hypothetical protein E7517_09235 [Ruminococcaceae bacterium]|nr:hypothetical protein [Oscillospiraceae bacterium]
MKKVISLLLVTLLVVGCFAGCAKNVTIECTCDCNAQAGGDTEYSTLKANGNSGVDCSNMPSDAAGILKLYNEVANATKAAPNQKLAKNDPGAKTDITALSTGGKPAGDGTMETVKGLVKSFAPAGVTSDYNFVNGVDSAVKDEDGNDSTTKDVLPVSGQDYMSALTDADITDATIEKLDDGYWKLAITVKPTEVEFTTPDNNPDTPQAKFTGVMKSSDLLKSFGPAKITYAKINYKESTLTAVIDPACGYLVQLVHHMDYVIDATGKLGFELQGSINVKSDIIYNWSEIG